MDSTNIYRYEKELPGVDIFVCTADPTVEPPIMVINTVLSVMAYDYPPEKLSVYLSDDGGSELTFYALLEASLFSKHWISYCKKYRVEPRSPAAYFTTSHHSAGPFDVNYSQDLAYIKVLLVYYMLPINKEMCETCSLILVAYLLDYHCFILFSNSYIKNQLKEDLFLVMMLISRWKSVVMLYGILLSN